MVFLIATDAQRRAYRKALDIDGRIAAKYRAYLQWHTLCAMDALDRVRYPDNPPIAPFEEWFSANHPEIRAFDRAHADALSAAARA